jgi:hypothetical protein
MPAANATSAKRFRWHDLSRLEGALRILLGGWAALTAFLASVLALAWATRNEDLFKVLLLLEHSAAVAVMLLGFAVTLVLYLIWKYRATSNRWCLDPATALIRPGWAVGWYFIPIANLVMPLKAMLQLCPPFEKRAYWWWGLYLASLICSVLSEILVGETASNSQLRWALRLMIGEWLFAGASALVLQGLVREIGRWQRQERQRPEAAPAALQLWDWPPRSGES